MNQKSDVIPNITLEEDVGLEEEKDLLAKRKGTKLSESIVSQPQQGMEVSDMESKVPDVLSHEVPAGNDPMNGLTVCTVTNGCTKEHVHRITFTGNGSARSKLLKICTARGWKEPLYDFEEQGPPHNKLFTCKVTVHVDGIVNTVMECFSDRKRQKKAAEEHAAQGALWCLSVMDM